MKRKIIAALFLAVLAIGLALTITHFSFREMLGTVNELAAPNPKLTRLNYLFEEITMLDQQQRAEVIQNPQKPYKYFLDQTGYVRMMIDSLLMLDWDTVQLRRLASLKTLLDERNEIFISYMKVKAEQSNNKEFSHQLDTLSALLKASQRHTDSIVTRQTKTITTILQQDSVDEKNDRGFLKKLFGKRKSKNAETPVVKEQLDVTIDTLTVARQATDYEEIKKLMKDLEKDQRSQRRKLENKELELINANSIFISELLNTLHEVENEEVEYMRANSLHASKVVNQGISRTSLVMLSFLLGGALLVYLIFIDISKSNYYKKQLEKARDHAEELTKIKQKFLANMSHEIRTPLQSIIGFAEQLKDQANNNNKESIEAIHSSSEHLLQIVNEVLDFSRISAGNFTLSKERFHLKRLFKEVEAAMRIQALKKNLSLLTNLNELGEYTLSGDAFRLRQILYNLVGNAIKFTTKGFVSLNVDAEDTGDNVRVTVEITDSGIGMTSEELKRVFNHFEQASVDIAKNYGGTGLGLSIVKALVDVHKGNLDVVSEPGKGSTFTVTLTFEKFGELARAATQTTEPITTPVAGKVIVVDDDRMILKLCSLILRKNNIVHEVFNEPEELLSKTADNSVTHILLDIRMPKMNGKTLCRLLRAKYKTAKFVALTAHVLPEEKSSLLEEGFDKVLTKPFHEKDLQRLLGVAVRTEKLKSEVPDFALLRQMTMGDEALFQSVMQQFLEDSDADIKLLKVSLENQDLRSIRDAVHKMAGRFGQMGIYSLSAKHHDIEVKIVNGSDIMALEAAIESCISQTEDMLETIRLTNIEHQN